MWPEIENKPRETDVMASDWNNWIHAPPIRDFPQLEHGLEQGSSTRSLLWPARSFDNNNRKYRCGKRTTQGPGRD